MFKSQKKQVILITIYIILFCSRVCNAQNNADSVKVTYISNTGFLISTSDKKVLIDAMFKTGYGYYLEPSVEIQEKMVNSTEPFENIDLILNTHSHADHFDAEMTVNHLANNSKGIFIGPKQTINMLKVRDDYNDISSQVQEINLELGSYTEREINGIEIKIFRIRHSPYYENGNDRHVNVQNLAYLMNLNGLKFLHFGDASTQFHENYIQNFQLDQENIDFLFIVYFSCIDSTINIMNQYIKPNYIIATHIPPSEFDMITDTFKNVFPKAIFFENSMESKSFKSNIPVNVKDMPMPNHIEIEQN